MPAAPSVSAARAASIAAPRVTDSPFAAPLPPPTSAPPAQRSGRRRLGLRAGRGGALRIRRIGRELVGLPLEADGARRYGILRSVPSGPRSQRSGTVGPAVGPVGTLP